MFPSILKAFGKNKFAKVIGVLNSLKENSLLEDYAITGDYALVFHSAPFTSFRFNVLCKFAYTCSKNLPKLHSFLTLKGFQYKEGIVSIHGVPVQFIAAGVASLEEASIDTAQQESILGQPFKIPTVEHVVASLPKFVGEFNRLKFELVKGSLEFDSIVLEDMLRKFGRGEDFIHFLFSSKERASVKGDGSVVTFLEYALQKDRDSSLKGLYKSMSIEEKVEAMFQLQLFHLRAAFLRKQKEKNKTS